MNIFNIYLFILKLVIWKILGMNYNITIVSILSGSAFNLESSNSTILNPLLTTTQSNNIQRSNSYLRSRTIHRSRNNSNNQINTASNYSLTDSKYNLTASNYRLTANSTDELMKRLRWIIIIEIYFTSWILCNT